MDKNALLRSMKLFLFDMDGTLYLGDRLYSFTIELLQTIRQKGGKYLFMTNNSSKSVEDYIKKLHKLGIESTREDFITSSQATAYYLHKYHEGQALYVCGTESLKAELRMEGFTVTENMDEVECIVMGFDTELTFKKLEDISKMLCFEHGKADYRKISDIELCTHLDQLARSCYGRHSVYQLTQEEKIRIANDLYQNHHIPESQIRRCLVLHK